MKRFVNATALVIFFSICINKSFAYNEINRGDTIHKELTASLDKSTETLVVLKEANVIYPEILSGNEAESIGYVEKFAASRKDYLRHTYNSSKKLFPKAEAILKKYNVPAEFKVLLALESGFNGNAVSSAGAVGYWQIMDDVAREYGLKISQDVKATKTARRNHKSEKKILDERKNFTRSTHAAARYLKDRGRNLNNDWLLIAASYNCGVGNVWNAMQRSGKQTPTFWDIKKYLPAATRAYVMNFITLNVIFNNYEAFSKNELCFRDITCKAGSDDLPGHPELSSSITE